MQNNYFEIEKAELSNDKVLKLLLKNFVKAENIKAFSYSPDLSLSTSLIEEKKNYLLKLGQMRILVIRKQIYFWLYLTEKIYKILR